jgi:hypothetical protein
MHSCQSRFHYGAFHQYRIAQVQHAWLQAIAIAATRLLVDRHIDIRALQHLHGTLDCTSQDACFKFDKLWRMLNHPGK